MRSPQIMLTALVASSVCLYSCGSDHQASDHGRREPERIEFPIAEHSIDPGKDTTIFGPQGTRIFIGSGTLQYADGTPVNDPVTIELKEFYDKEDMLLADLYTRSGDRLIETAGMIHLAARANGQELSIADGKRVVVHFPKRPNDYRKMSLFYADETANDSSVSNWNVDTVDLVKRTLRLASFGWWHPSHDDSTRYDFRPQNFLDTGYYWNPLDHYVRSYDFSEQAMREIETTRNRNDYEGFEWWNTNAVECEMRISKEGNIIAPKVNTPVSSNTRKEIITFLKKLPPLAPGTDKNGNIIERRGLLLIRPGNIVPLYQTDKEYISSFDAKYAAFEDRPIKSMDDAELNYYIFSVSKLGWINCDRFIGEEETIDLIVDTPADEKTKLKMAFSDIDAILPASMADGKYVFRRVPKGREVTIMGIRNDHGNFMTAFKRTRIGEGPVTGLTFSETTLADLRTALAEI